MKVLTINTGSSTVKYDLYENKNHVYKGRVDRIGTPKSFILEGKKIENIPIKTFTQAAKWIANRISEPDVISYRIVYAKGINQPTLISNSVLNKIKEGIQVDPLHNPKSLEVINVLQSKFPKTKHLAVFDTEVHQSIKESRKKIPIPSKYNLEKIGFHGLVVESVIDYFKKLKLINKKIIAVHLGNGCSITSIKNGRVIDNSMDYTPLAGLPMGTRSGSLDPGVVLHLIKKEGLKKTENILWNESGLKGYSDGLSDIRDLMKSKKGKDSINIFVQRIVDSIGSNYFKLKGADIICFSGGIPENEFWVVRKIFSKIDFLGIKLNGNKSGEITVKKCKIKAFIVKANEEDVLMKKAIKYLGSN